MAIPRRFVLIAGVMALSSPLVGCGPNGDNEAVFAGGGGKPDPNVPSTSEEYDKKFQVEGPPPARKAK
ncbi:hypothetical protein TA3x_003199 [Tundrisphaera sp. TA3]|uniref:hypothetical protein n=1 Tax=Tundrisphaera sp. TA3 TaxID=3435775 RepID=UPI003EBDA107